MPSRLAIAATLSLFAVGLVVLTSPIQAQPEISPAQKGPGGPAPLILQSRAELQLAGAEAVLTAARKKADAMKLSVNIAVVDDGGHLIAFARMDKARPASAATAMTKAVTAATFRQPTGTLPAGGEPDVLLNISLQNAAAASGGKITTLKGGVPIVVRGEIIGAIGVGGATGEQDAEIARAGAQALITLLLAP